MTEQSNANIADHLAKQATNKKDSGQVVEYPASNRKVPGSTPGEPEQFVTETTKLQYQEETPIPRHNDETPTPMKTGTKRLALVLSLILEGDISY